MDSSSERNVGRQTLVSESIFFRISAPRNSAEPRSGTDQHRGPWITFTGGPKFRRKTGNAFLTGNTSRKPTN